MTITFPIETERLVVRPMVPDDARALHELYSDPVAMQHLADDLPGTVHESRQWVLEKIDLHARTGLSMWAVVDKVSRAVLGDAGLQLLDDQGTIEIGARIIRKHWGHGYGREAAAALLQIGFEQLDVDRIVGVTSPANARAHRAMEHLGMRCVGTERHFGREWTVYEARR